MRFLEKKIQEFDRILLVKNPVLYSSLLPGTNKSYFDTSFARDLMGGMFVPEDIQMLYRWRSGTDMSEDYLHNEDKGSLEIDNSLIFLDIRQSMQFKFDRRIKKSYMKEGIVSQENDVLFVPLLVSGEYFASYEWEENTEGFSCVCFPICKYPLKHSPLIYTSSSVGHGSMESDEFIFDNVWSMLSYWCEIYDQDLMAPQFSGVNPNDWDDLRRRQKEISEVSLITNYFSNSISAQKHWRGK